MAPQILDTPQCPVEAMTLRLTACVVLYRHSEQQIAALLESITDSKNSLRCVVVDNSPSNDIEAYVRASGLDYVHNPANPGFGASHNLGFSYFPDSDVHFVLNPDVHFGSDALGMLAGYLVEHPDVALVSPRVVYPDGRLQRLCKLLPNPMNLFARRFMPPLARLLDRQFELQHFSYDTEADIPYMSGCFMAIRAEAFRLVGGFDEKFFMYLEDTDLSRRLLSVGRLVFYPACTIVHVFEKASYRNPRLLRAHIESAIYYFNKWGWVFDSERRRINRATLKQLG